jgi:DNA-nicking Smr family endonuclease
VEGEHRYIDLHGLPIDVARTALSLALEEMGKGGGPAFDVRVITGRGNHVNSSGEKGVLRQGLRAFVLSLPPLGLLELEEVQGNDGCFVIKKSGIAKWLDAKARIVK